MSRNLASKIIRNIFFKSNLYVICTFSALCPFVENLGKLLAIMFINLPPPPHVGCSPAPKVVHTAPYGAKHYTRQSFIKSNVISRTFQLTFRTENPLFRNLGKTRLFRNSFFITTSCKFYKNIVNRHAEKTVKGTLTEDTGYVQIKVVINTNLLNKNFVSKNYSVKNSPKI